MLIGFCLEKDVQNLPFALKALCSSDFRLYPGWSTILKPEEPFKPVLMEVRVLDRVIDRVEKSSDIGMFETVVLFGENAIRFDGIWLEKTLENNNIASELEEVFD